MKAKLFLGILFVFALMSLVSAETFHIDDSFKVGWTDGTDNYEATYKVWKIETTAEGNTTTLLLMPTGIIGISNKKQGDTYTLGANAKIHFNQVYVLGNDKYISITLENAQFKTDTSAPPSSGGSGGGGGSGSSSGGGGSGGSSGSQYKTYEISNSQLDSGYTKDLSPGDRINFPMGDNKGYVSVLSVYINGAEMGIFAHDRKIFYTEEHPDVNIMPSQQKFEMTEDNYYDLKVTLNSAVINEDGTRVASVTLKKIHEEIPEDAENYYDCWKYYTCRDGTKIKYCDYSSNGMCGCRGVSSSECPTPSSPSSGGGGGSGAINNSNITSPSSGGGGGGSSTCEKFYNCSDGSQVQYCFIHRFYNENGEVVGAGCGCKSNPQSLCTSSSSGGGGGSGGQPILINSSSGGGSGGGSIGTNVTPIICDGCILGNKCAPIGYRQDGKYCTINSEFISQSEADASCNNNFECSTNLCIDNKCVSSGLWQKFIRWLSRLFG
jgi:uncharacterized membrane protein YgcG